MVKFRMAPQKKGRREQLKEPQKKTSATRTRKRKSASEEGPFLLGEKGESHRKREGKRIAVPRQGVRIEEKVESGTLLGFNSESLSTKKGGGIVRERKTRKSTNIQYA